MSFDKRLISQTFTQIHEAILQIREWNSSVKSTDDYLLGHEGMKTLVAHGYFDIDAEIIFDVVNNELDSLDAAVVDIIQFLSGS